MNTSSSNHDSITVWLSQLRAGDPLAAAKLWDRFFDRLVAVAKQKLATANRRVADEEDIAIGVMASLCECARRGQLPAIDNRDDLWLQLLSWTKHDVIDHVRAASALKRGGNRVRGDSVFLNELKPNLGQAGFDEIADLAASPEMLAEMDEQLHQLLGRLPDAVLRLIANRKMEGYTNQEIAIESGVSVRTIDRKLDLIRRYWKSG